MSKIPGRLIEVLKWNVIIAVITEALIQLIWGIYSLEVIIGTGTAFINFLGNSIVSTIVFKKASSISIMLYVLSYLIRIFLPGGIAYMIYIHTINGVLLFVLGYALHFISLVIISTKKLTINEGE